MNNEEKIDDKTAGNIEIFPASLFPLKEVWKAISHKLPAGSFLLVMPKNNTQLKRKILHLAQAFHQSGRRVEILDQETALDKETHLEDGWKWL